MNRTTIDFQCPKCSFYNSVFLKQIILCDIIICRGCKFNIHLKDQMASLKGTIRRIHKAIQNLQDTLNNL
jgi:hypothetical protein